MALDISELRRKAESGSSVGQSMLGICYLYGIDVQIDYKEAFRLLSAAAQQGASRAVLNLGRMYAQGLGIPVNLPEAIRHFEAVAKPADGSDAFPARIELGRLFSRGSGVPADPKVALKWYSDALAIATADDDPDKVKEAREYVQGH